MNPHDIICPACHIGKLDVRKVTYSQVLEGHLLVIPNVSALVCDMCGERVLDDEVLSRLSGLLGPLRQGNWPVTRRA